MQFSHATPAAYVAHNADRNDYLGIATEMIDSELSVIMGAGHPGYDDSHRELATPSYTYVSADDHVRLTSGQTGFEYIEEKSQFEALAAGEDVPERVFGLAQVASTLQQGRAATGEENAPYDTPLNDVPSLETMTEGAFNVLEQDEDGFFLMVEGGAIDWTGHANDTARNIEETQDFNASVEAAIEWLESDDSEASWDDTLIIVTADHETGYLAGPGSDPGWTAMTGEAGELPSVDWYSGGHTNMVVPVWAKGAGREALFARADATDPLRGTYIDNTDLANVLLEDLWAGALPVDPAVEELADALDGYIAGGEVAGPIARQLGNALDQALRHLDGERVTPALRAMERFVDHLEDPKRPDTVSQRAADDLGAQAAEILGRLR